MANWIESQLCVRGEKDSIENFKNSFISIDKEGYSFDFDRLFLGYEYVLPKAFLEEHHPGKSFSNVLVLEEHSPNFEINYKDGTNYYQFVRHHRFNPYSWVEPGHHTKDMSNFTDDQIVLQFTSKWSPPIQAFIHLSKSYPDLFFRLAFYDISEAEYWFGCVEGSNGVFKDSNIDFGYYDERNNRPVYRDESLHWHYVGTDEPLEFPFQPGVTNYLFLNRVSQPKQQEIEESVEILGE